MKTREDERIGSYVLGPEIGKGAAGIVRSATSPDLTGPLAVKILRSDLVEDEQSIARFLREKELFSSVAHSNVVKVHDLVVEDDQVGIVMELLPGGDLRSLMQTESLTPTQTIDIVRKIADGLAQIHAVDVLHRDLKPANVLTAGPPDDRTVKIADFGISTLVGEALTYGSQSLGSPLYMAPEVTGTGPVGTASDVYSLGVLLFEMLTGHPPFQGENILAVILAHSQRPAPELKGVPSELSDLVAEMLHKLPADRPLLSDVISRLRALSPLIDDEMLPAVSSPLTGEVAPFSHILGERRLPPAPEASGLHRGPASLGTKAMDLFAERRARNALAIGAVAAVLILLAGITFIVNGLGGSQEQSEQARTLFEPELRNDVLLVTRDWTIDVGGALVSTTLITNIGNERLDIAHLEILPPDLTDDVLDRVEFTVTPTSVDREHANAIFEVIGIDAQQTVSIGYRLPFTSEQRETGLDELASQARSNEIAALAEAGDTTRALRYRSLGIAPESFALVAGAAPSTAVLFGEPQDAHGLWLELPSHRVKWTVKDTEVATLDARGILTPVAEGVTVMEAEYDALITVATVQVRDASPSDLASTDNEQPDGATVNSDGELTEDSSGGASATFPGREGTIPPAAPTAEGQSPSTGQRGATTRRRRPVSPNEAEESATTTTINVVTTTTLPLTTSSIEESPATTAPDEPITSSTEPLITVVTLSPTTSPEPTAPPTTTTTVPDIGPPTVTSPPTTTETTMTETTIAVTTVPETTVAPTTPTTEPPVDTTAPPTTQPTTTVAPTTPTTITETTEFPITTSPPVVEQPIQTTSPTTTATSRPRNTRPNRPNNTRPTPP